MNNAFYAVPKLGPALPHLKGVLIAFFEKIECGSEAILIVD
jgi:hypothetical protein